MVPDFPQENSHKRICFLATRSWFCALIDLDEGQGEIKVTVLPRLSVRDLTHSCSFCVAVDIFNSPGLKGKIFLFHACLLIPESWEH